MNLNKIKKIIRNFNKFLIYKLDCFFGFYSKKKYNFSIKFFLKSSYSSPYYLFSYMVLFSLKEEDLRIYYLIKNIIKIEDLEFNFIPSSINELFLSNFLFPFSWFFFLTIFISNLINIWATILIEDLNEFLEFIYNKSSWSRWGGRSWDDWDEEDDDDEWYTEEEEENVPPPSSSDDDDDDDDDGINEDEDEKGDGTNLSEEKEEEFIVIWETRYNPFNDSQIWYNPYPYFTKEWKKEWPTAIVKWKENYYSSLTPEQVEYLRMYKEICDHYHKIMMDDLIARIKKREKQEWEQSKEVFVMFFFQLVILVILYKSSMPPGGFTE